MHKTSTSINPNDVVFIKPTNYGWKQILATVDKYNDDLRQSYPNALWRMSAPKPDKEGFIEGQFWELMSYFDWKNYPSFGELPFSELKLKLCRN